MIDDLRRTVPGFREDHATIVHGDLRHSNWIETESGLVYLVDWDSVRLTDRMFDVAHMLMSLYSRLSVERVVDLLWLQIQPNSHQQTILVCSVILLEPDCQILYK